MAGTGEDQPQISEGLMPHYVQTVSEIFFNNPRSYTPFHLTQDRRQMIACVEPRNEKKAIVKRIKTAIQTAGGGVGEGLDRAVAATAETGEFVPIEDGVSQEAVVRGATVLGGHLSCKFVTSLEPVLEEAVEPSDFTKDDLFRTWRQRDIVDDMAPIMPKVTDAAKKQLERVRRGDLPDLLALIDSEYPEHANITDVEGENLASIYVTNNHPYLGLNRDRKARLSAEGAAPIQGYHESRMAAALDIYNSYLRRQERAFRMCALYLRSSAARTVLGSLRHGTLFYEVHQGPNGLVIAEQEGL